MDFHERTDLYSAGPALRRLTLLTYLLLQPICLLQNYGELYEKSLDNHMSE